jgi:hypothetical protein
MNQRDSREMFTEGGEDNFGAEMRRKDVALDEIKEEILRHHGHGMDAATKASKAETLEKVAGTRSWAKLESMRLPDVQATRNALWKLTRGHEYGAEPIQAEQPTPPETVDGDDKIPHEAAA